MLQKIVFIALVCPIFCSATLAQNYDVLPSSGRNELFHDYLLEELDKLMGQRNKVVESALASPEKMQTHQKELRKKYLKLLGDLPEKTPLQAKVTETINAKGGYNIEKLHFQSVPNHHVTANFYIPSSNDGPYPTVLVLCGHYPIAKTYIDYQKLCISLAKNGIAAMIVDPVCQGERYQVTSANGRLSMLGQSGTGAHSRLDVGAVLTGTSIVAYELWDNHRAVDYLYTRTDVVDTARVGCTGHSGGGAQATYLLAYDERIKVGTIANFITNETSMFTESGPQTGSQNLSFEGELGIDQPDYVALFAPKPLLMIGTTTDAIFKIIAARKTLAEVKKVYGLLSDTEKVDLFVTSDAHDYTQPKREATVEWYKKWFMKDESPAPEGSLQTLNQNQLTVSSTGQVYTAFENEVNITELNQEKAEDLQSSRFNFWNNHSLNQCLDTIKNLVRYEPLSNTVENTINGTIDRDSYAIEKSKISYANHVPITALTFAPKKINGRLPAVLFVDGRGKKTDAGSGGVIENVYMKNNDHIVMSIDVRGFGETSDNPLKNESKHNNLEHRNGVISLFVGKTLVGQRVQDIEKALQVLLQRTDVDTSNITLIGVDRASVAVLHAAAFNQQFKNVILRMAKEAPWIDAVTNPNIKDQMTHEVPDVLKYYSLTDLVRYGFENRKVIYAEEPFKGDPVATHTALISPTNHSNYPNPFPNKTTIPYFAENGSEVTLNVFNGNGEKVKCMTNLQNGSGLQTVELDATDFSNGIYVYQLVVNEKLTSSNKMWVKKY